MGVNPPYDCSFSVPHVSDVRVFEVVGPGTPFGDRDCMKVGILGHLGLWFF